MQILITLLLIKTSKSCGGPPVQSMENPNPNSNLKPKTDGQIERSEIIGPFWVNRRTNKIYNLNGLPVEQQPKPKTNADHKTEPQPNPHGPTSKGT